MIAIHQNKVLTVQEKYKTKISLHRDSAIKNLTDLESITSDQNDLDYVQTVKELFNNNQNILIWTPSELISSINDSQLVVPLVQKAYKSGVKMVQSDIKKSIINALGYKKLRSEFYPSYFRDIGIKSCVYCNSQLTVSVDKKDGISAKFDVDHFHSKDKFPFLSICLFNLYPSCPSCNRAKSTKKIEFQLYSEDTKECIISPYSFSLDRESKAKYLTTKDANDLKFSYHEPDYSDGAESFNDTFHIEGIYNTQKDIIEELILKSQTYNSNYISLLKNNFEKLALNPELFKRMLVGNYTEDKDMHKRPLSKFTQDIARQLKFIK